MFLVLVQILESVCTQFLKLIIPKYPMKQDKAPFVAKAKSKKTEYAATMQQYNMELVNHNQIIPSPFFFFLAFSCVDKYMYVFCQANGTKTAGDDEKQEVLA